MRILFYGGRYCNNGPDNVNKGIVKNLSDSFYYTKITNKYLEFVEAVWKLLFCRVVVVSGVCRKGCLLTGIARKLGKKSVYIMHGCAEHETKLNGIQLAETERKQAEYLMKNADLLLPVSRKFMLWVQTHYPQYADKTKYLFNGIDITAFAHISHGVQRAGSVAVSGGMSPLKNNLIVAEAVEMLEGKAFLEVYGSEETGAVDGKRHSCLAGKLPNADFLQQLSTTQLFVLNSVFETFSLAALEALVCGCSVLLSEIAGVTDLLALEESDIIHDPMDVEEIRSKIEYLLEHPNNGRLMAKLDLNKYSFAKMVERLEDICADLVSAK